MSKSARVFKLTKEKIMRNRCAFTLIEILVVVAIIGILAAILFPVFSRAREMGRRAACISNLKQIGLAISGYSADFDEKMPYGYLYYAPGPSPTDLRMWDDLIQPYLKNYQVLVCPSHAQPIAYDYRRAILPNPFLKSYAANELTDAPSSTLSTLAAMPRGNPLGPPTGLASFAEVSTTITLGECISGDATVAEFDFFARTDAGFNGTQTLCLDKRHSGGSNYLFADGHVKWLGKTTTSMWTLAAD